ncbi:MAG: Fe-S-cluster-containing dehydrogenase component [Cognaticolwellia sp.]|jgi:Fe-S-cluster-containing dehydrogenase component
MPLPWEPSGTPIEDADPVMVVDTRRCTGCHACSVACKVEHQVPLGEFRLRVRWLPDPKDGTMAFLPLFNASQCDYGADRSQVGLPPACVGACPTGALIFGDSTSKAITAQKTAGAEPLAWPADSKPGVLYRGAQPWQAEQLNNGVMPHHDDPDPIYEMGKGQDLSR